MGRLAVSLLKDARPDLAAQVVDRDLLPTLATSAHRKIEWRCPKGHVWSAFVYARSARSGCGCPVCSGKLCQVGANDLETMRPDVSALLVDRELGRTVTEFSNRRLRWRCPDCGHVWTAPVARLTAQGSRCPVCGNKRKGSGRRKGAAGTRRPMTTEEFTDRARSVHGDAYDYSETVYRGSQEKVVIICPRHGRFEQRATSHLQGMGCRRCAMEKVARTRDSTHREERFRRTMLERHGADHPMHSVEIASRMQATRSMTVGIVRSGEERDLADSVMALVGRDAVSLNDRTVLPGARELDVVVPDRKIAIEFNGVYWHSEAQLANHGAHAAKARACAEAGYQLITVWEDDWRDRRDVVVKTLAHKLHAVDRLREAIDCDDADVERAFARKLEVAETSNAQVAPFWAANHIQGPVTCSRIFALVDGTGRMRAALGVRSPRNCARMRRGKGVWEIQRYATQGIVPGGFTRLVACAERTLRPIGLTSWVSFSDECVSSGGLYRVAGFRVDKVLRPDYRYTGRLTDWVRVPKERFQKRRFKDDPNLIWEDGLTEHELALRNGLYRVYDCGKVRWVRDAG